MEEIWKDIPGYEGYYQVSNLGRVKSLSRTILRNGKYPFVSKEKLLSPALLKNGYLSILLSKDKELKSFTIHKLVAMAFLNHKPCGLKLVVNHINFNKLDNRVQNLEIVTQRQNTSHRNLKSSSQYTGVQWRPKRNKWYARIHIKGKETYLGCFINEYEAHLAYQKALSKLSCD